MSRFDLILLLIAWFFSAGASYYLGKLHGMEEIVALVDGFIDDIRKDYKHKLTGED